MQLAPLILSFPDATPAEADQLARRLQTMLREELPEVKVQQTRSDPHAQGEGDLLAVLAQIDPKFLEALGHTIAEHATTFGGVVAGTVLFETLRHSAGALGTRIRFTHSESKQSGEINVDGKIVVWPAVP